MTYRRYKYILDYAIVDVLDTKLPSYLRYQELEQEISLHCKLSSSTLARHLKRLVGGTIVERKVEKDGHTSYSLTRDFREKLDIKKKSYPMNYLDMTFSLYPFNQYQYEVSYSFHKDRFKIRYPIKPVPILPHKSSSFTFFYYLQFTSYFWLYVL
jgi:DNA-binding MarR family transcriptional regulator